MKQELLKYYEFTLQVKQSYSALPLQVKQFYKYRINRLKNNFMATHT